MSRLRPSSVAVLMREKRRERRGEPSVFEGESFALGARPSGSPDA